MTPLILDILIIAIIALFAFLGWRKGLVLTFCGLLAVFVAFAGASFVSGQFSEDVAGILQPSIQNQIEQALEGLRSLSQQAPPDAPSDGATLDQVLEALSQSDLFSSLQQTVTEAIQNGLVQVTTTAPAAIASYLSLQIARIGLFFLTFFLILLVWSLLSHALDLACRLPVLRTFNEVGGLIIGLAKGALISLAVAWLLSLSGIAAPEHTQQTYLFQMLLNFQLL